MTGKRGWSLIGFSMVTACWLSMGAAAHAEIVRGTFRFADAPTSTCVPIEVCMPIKGATVEIYRHRPWQLGWSVDFVAFTDESGSINVSVPYAGKDVVTTLRVYANNTATTVLKEDDPFQAFYQQPGFPNPGIQRVTTSPNDVLDFSFDFTDEWSSAHYNAAQAAKMAKDYADARRDPRQRDPIEPLHIQIQENSAPTYFDPASHRIRIGVLLALSDLTVIHEYAHYLEQKISSFQSVASYHNGCIFQAGQGGVDIASPGLAWMEGFADYFAQAVALANPSVKSGPYGDGTLPVSQLEAPQTICGASTTPEKVEAFVAGALWDLIDNTPKETGDRYCASAALPMDTIIFQIFDHELGLTPPAIQTFMDAWIGRGFDLPQLVSTFGRAAINLVRPQATHHYDPGAGADWAVWRPADGNFWVLWKNGTSNVTQWGTAGDVPVPADYDGDGITDLAVWRPSEGNWWVILSSTNVIQVTRWGDPTDIPLPADYDGDGEVDFAVYKPSTQQVIIKNDSCGADRSLVIGSGIPIVGNFDSDGRADPGVYNASTGLFAIQSSVNALVTRQLPTTALTMPAIGDFDGDKKTDFAVFNAMSGAWTIVLNSTGVTTTVGHGQPYAGRGLTLATAVPADFDGDGKTDLAVWYDSSGVWSVLQSTAGSASQQWGTNGDRPVPRR